MANLPWLTALSFVSLQALFTPFVKPSLGLRADRRREEEEGEGERERERGRGGRERERERERERVGRETREDGNQRTSPGTRSSQSL